MHLYTVQCLFDKYITSCTESIANGAIDVNKKDSMRTILYQTHLNMLNQFCCVFDALFPLTSSSKLDKQYSDAVIESGFVDVLKFEIINLNSIQFWIFSSAYINHSVQHLMLPTASDSMH